MLKRTCKSPLSTVVFNYFLGFIFGITRRLKMILPATNISNTWPFSPLFTERHDLPSSVTTGTFVSNNPAMRTKCTILLACIKPSSLTLRASDNWVFSERPVKNAVIFKKFTILSAPVCPFYIRRAIFAVCCGYFKPLFCKLSLPHRASTNFAWLKCLYKIGHFIQSTSLMPTLHFLGRLLAL